MGIKPSHHGIAGGWDFDINRFVYISNFPPPPLPSTSIFNPNSQLGALIRD